ncbi:MAG: STN domain-containing protein [Planctomycetaceae bacterium]|nr:STN domain-containing protein [Planctomycetaceae bacterium]
MEYARTPLIMASLMMCLWGCGPEAPKRVLPPSSATQPATELSRNARALKALDQKIQTFSFKETDFKDVIQFLRDSTGLNIYVRWDELAKAGMGRGSTVTLSEENKTARQCLELTLARATQIGKPLAYRIADGIIIVSTHADAEKTAAIIESHPTVAKDTPRNTFACGRMQEHVRELRFDECELHDILIFFSDVTGTSLFVDWPALAEAGVDRTMPVTLFVKDISCHASLSLALRQSTDGRISNYCIADGVIIISTQKRAEEIARRLNSPPPVQHPSCSLPLCVFASQVDPNQLTQFISRNAGVVVRPHSVKEQKPSPSAQMILREAPAITGLRLAQFDKMSLAEERKLVTVEDVRLGNTYGKPASGLSLSRDAAARARLYGAMPGIYLEGHIFWCAASELGRLASVDVYLNEKTLSEAGVDSRRNLDTLEIDRCPFSEAFEKLFRTTKTSRPLTYTIADGVMLIAPAEEAQRLKKLIESPPKPARSGEEELCRRLRQATVIEDASTANKKEISISYYDPLDVVAQDLSKSSGVNIRVDTESLQKAKLKTNECTVTLFITNASLHTVLTLILDSAGHGTGLTYRIDNGQIVIYVPGR